MKHRMPSFHGARDVDRYEHGIHLAGMQIGKHVNPLLVAMGQANSHACGEYLCWDVQKPSKHKTFPIQLQTLLSNPDLVILLQHVKSARSWKIGRCWTERAG